MKTKWLLPLALLGCPEEEPVEDTCPNGATYTGCLADCIEVSPGAGTTFTPLADGDSVTLVHGPQGGWHIDVAGEVLNTEDLVTIDAVFVDTATGTQIAGDQTANRTALVGWSEDECSGTFSGVRVFVDDLPGNVTQADICALEGATLELTLSVTAFAAEPPATATQVVEVIAELDPNDVEPCSKL